VAVAVRLFQARLVHVLMSVLSPIVVGVGVFVGHMVVRMGGVWVGVSLLAVLVLVRVRRVVRVLLGHVCQLSLRYIHFIWAAADSVTAFSPASSRW
jgi:hypothetical protein